MLDSKKQYSVLSKRCGSHDGEPLYLITLNNDDVTVELTNLGGTITAIFTADRNGNYQNIVAGYDTLDRYHDNPHYFGCILGRYAGRISGSRFRLDGDVISLHANDGVIHLHGGAEGFNKKVWKIKAYIKEETATGVVLEYLSPDGEEGYPGNLSVTVSYILDTENYLKIIYEAVTDKSTPVNLSNHSYFNLRGFRGDVLGHTLWLNASAYTESNDENLPTGRISPVAGSALDFREGKTIGADIGQLAATDGYNHNYVLDGHAPGPVRLAAILSDADSGRVIKVHTDRPGVQLYTANDWQGNIVGPQGCAYTQHIAVALETQAFPDSPNHSNFPDTILRPGERFMSETIYEFSIMDK